MELDELKKSWNALDAQLQKEPIADEKQIKELIANYKTNTRHSLGRLVILQRFSLGTGAVGLAVILLVWFLLPTFGFNEHLQNKIILFLIFITVTILSGMWWDWKTYLWNKNTHIDEMSVAEVSRRMTRFRNWTRYEIWGSGCLDRYLHHTVLLDNGLLYTASHGTSRLDRLLHHPGYTSYLFHI